MNEIEPTTTAQFSTPFSEVASQELRLVGRDFPDGTWALNAGDETLAHLRLGHEDGALDVTCKEDQWRLVKHKIMADRCAVVAARTCDAVVPAVIDMLHLDANHGPQAVEDVKRWAPSIREGGLLIINDLGWAGGHVQRARDVAIELGFVEQYPLGTGCVMQRVKA